MNQPSNNRIMLNSIWDSKYQYYSIDSIQTRSLSSGFAGSLMKLRGFGRVGRGQGHNLPRDPGHCCGTAGTCGLGGAVVGRFPKSENDSPRDSNR